MAKGGSVTIDSRGNFTLNGTVDTSAIANASDPYSGNGGDVTVLAQGDISLNARASIYSSGSLGGNITLVSGGAISATGGRIGSSSDAAKQGVKGGDVNVTANSLSLSGGADLITATFGEADAGSVNINAHDTITLNGVGSYGGSGAFSEVDKCEY